MADVKTVIDFSEVEIRALVQEAANRMVAGEKAGGGSTTTFHVTRSDGRGLEQEYPSGVKTEITARVEYTNKKNAR